MKRDIIRLCVFGNNTFKRGHDTGTDQRRVHSVQRVASHRENNAVVKLGSCRDHLVNAQLPRS